MNISLLKKINERMPYWMKKPFAKIIRNKLIKNKVFLEEYKSLCQYDEMDVDEKNEKQLELLKKTVQHAYYHTKYYHDLFDKAGFDCNSINSVEDLQKIPVLTKEILKNNLEDLLADDLDNYYLVTTGGTSGEPVKVYMEKNAIYREWAFVYHYWSKYGYDFQNSRLATFRGVDLGDRLYEINPLYNEIRMNSFVLSEENVKKYVQLIDKYGAGIIYGYPSSVYNFCRLAVKKGIDIQRKFKAAFLISENLYSFQEEVIHQALGCEIAIFYGHSERAVFGEKYSCGYVFNQLYGVTELSSSGEPIITGFINNKTPLIRYVADDQVSIIKNQFYDIPGHTEVSDSGKYNMSVQNPGSIFLTDEIHCDIKGHRDMEVLYGASGQHISVAAINFHDHTFDKVEGYQFIQDKPGDCLMLLKSENLSQNEIEAIQNHVNHKFGSGVKCKVKITDKLKLTPRGKYKMIIQNWREN